jgi:pantetheine-phosphate adenylyltransferase
VGTLARELCGAASTRARAPAPHDHSLIAIFTPARIESSIQPLLFLRGRLHKGIAIYPGSFDPTTNGHLDLIERGAKIFEELVVAILRNSEKSPMFSVAERLQMLRALTAHLKNVRIDTFDGLMVEYAKSLEATCILRGIRAISDYEYELQMALMNRKLEPTLETVFMMPADKYSYVSSRLVREVAQAGGPVKGLVPEVVEQKLREKLDPAYKLRDARMIEVLDRKEFDRQERKKRKKKA